MYKKLSVLFILILLLVGCQKELKFNYDLSTPVSVKWITGESITVDDEIIQEALHDLLNDQLIELVENFDVTDYEITIGDIKIRSNYVRVEDVVYQFNYVREQDLYTLLQEYIREPEIVVDEEETLDFNLEEFTYLATLKDHSKIYYHDIGFYNVTPLVDEIVVIKDNELLLHEIGHSTIPDISYDQMSFAYIEGVGFEHLGSIKVYKDEELITYDSHKLLAKLNESRTFKSFEWLEDGKALSIIGYDSGTVTQGGDLYIVDLEHESIRLLLDAGKGYEIVKHNYEEDLDFTLITWIDASYQFYRYIDSNIDISNLSNFPIRISWQPWNLNKEPLNETEIYSNSMFNPETTKTDVLSLETTDGQNFNGDGYSVHFDGEDLSRIDVTGEYLLPRDIEIGQSLIEIIEKFPQELNYLETEDGYFYIYENAEAQFREIQDGYRLFFVTEGPIFSLEFKWDKLTKASVYFYQDEQ